MKSIKTKILLTVCLLVTISLSLVGGSVSVLMYVSSMNQLEKTMTEAASVSAQLVVEYLETYKAIATESGTIQRLSNPEISPADKQKIIDNKVKQYNFVGGGIINAQGMNVHTNTSLSDRDYFQAALKGEAYISDVLLGRNSGKYTLNIAAPIWANGVPDTTIVGVVYYNVDAQRLSDITNSIQIGDTGSAYMIDKANYTIAHKTLKIEDRDNAEENAKNDPKLAQLVQLQQKMCAGETGFGQYSYEGIKKILAYAPVGINGWSIAVNANLSEFIQNTLAAIAVTGILVVIAIVVGIAMSIYLANSVTKPVREIEHIAKELSEGRLNATIAYHSKDELGSLAENMRSAMSTLKTYITDINYTMQEFSSGNFALKPPTKPFIGDFKAIEDSIENTSEILSDTLLQIRTAADQVSTGADQVSSGAQQLSQGAIEQSSSIEELSATIAEVSKQISHNAESSAQANNMSVNAADAIQSSNHQMQNLMQSMGEIDSKSQEISKIIKTIDDIAFQTNILALNAAVEAARAGTAGKGFAVVADEVRNLAGKSAEAAKNTTVLIEDSVATIAEGVRLADITATELNSAVDNVAKTTEIITEITKASKDQAQAVEEITQGIDQVSAVVQTNSATAEESAAASEELLGQASMLNQLVAQFKLKDNDKR